MIILQWLRAIFYESVSLGERIQHRGCKGTMAYIPLFPYSRDDEP
jgi:hypothetical protein